MSTPDSPLAPFPPPFALTTVAVPGGEINRFAGADLNRQIDAAMAALDKDKNGTVALVADGKEVRIALVERAFNDHVHVVAVASHPWTGGIDWAAGLDVSW